MNSTEVASKTKYTLFTNVSFVQIETGLAIRLSCQSILLEEGTIGMLVKTQNRIRGFGPDAAWPIFTCWEIPQEGPISYSVRGHQDKSMVFLGSGKNTKPKPIFGGSILTVHRPEKNLDFFLQAEDASRPLDIFECIGDIDRVWNELEIRVANYWRAPFIPHSFYGPALERAR